jgi:hypothetical protein
MSRDSSTSMNSGNEPLRLTGVFFHQRSVGWCAAAAAGTNGWSM